MYSIPSQSPPKASGRKGSKKVRTGCITCKFVTQSLTVSLTNSSTEFAKSNVMVTNTTPLSDLLLINPQKASLIVYDASKQVVNATATVPPPTHPQSLHPSPQLQASTHPKKCAPLTITAYVLQRFSQGLSMLISGAAWFSR